MSADRPPDPYFNNINFNPLFFSSVISDYLTEIIANAKYLQLTGGTITGNLRVNNNTIFGTAPYSLNIIPFSSTTKAQIYTQNNGLNMGDLLIQPFTGGNVGIGTTNPQGYVGGTLCRRSILFFRKGKF